MGSDDFEALREEYRTACRLWGDYRRATDTHVLNLHRSRKYRQEHIASVACGWAFDLGRKAESLEHDHDLRYCDSECVACVVNEFLETFDGASST